MSDRNIFRNAVPEQTTTRSASLGNVMFGIVLIAAGALWLLVALDVIDISWRTIMAGALTLVGVALIIGATQGAHPGLITAGVVLTIVLGLASTADRLLDVPFTGGIGDANYTPPAAAAIEEPYRLAIGDLSVDLRTTEFPPGLTEIEASVGIGQLTIRVPGNLAVEIIGSVGAGRMLADGKEYSGTGVDEVITQDGFADAPVRLRINARVGLGNIEVAR